MSPLGMVHLATAFVAIGAGAATLVIKPKGSRLHRRLGWTYVGAMLVLNATALLIYRLFGGFGPFHVAALVSLATIVPATLAAIGARRARLRRDRAARARRVATHYWMMTFSYVGLLAAFVSETATRLPIARPKGAPGVAFAVAVAISTLAVVGVGAWLIRRRATTMLAPFA